MMAVFPIYPQSMPKHKGNSYRPIGFSKACGHLQSHQQNFTSFYGPSNWMHHWCLVGCQRKMHSYQGWCWTWWFNESGCRPHISWGWGDNQPHPSSGSIRGRHWDVNEINSTFNTMATPKSGVKLANKLDSIPVTQGTTFDQASAMTGTSLSKANFNMLLTKITQAL